jgi:exosortase/archaeosortase family protein
VAIVVAFFLSSSYCWNLTAGLATGLDSFFGVPARYLGEQLAIYVMLPDGRLAVFQVLLECSGLVTLMIFAFLSAFTIGLLKGSLKVKLAWFGLSLAFGYIWNLFRVSLVVAMAYEFGMSAYSFTHYILGPTIDFLWIVCLWAVGLALLKRGKQE